MMSQLAEFEFLRPWWLLSLLVVPLFAFWLHRRRLSRTAWRSAVDAHLLPHLLEGRLDAPSRWSLVLPLTALALAIVALAGPSVRHVPQALYQDRSPLVIVVDLSSASRATDVAPSRLQLEKAKISRLLQQHGHGQVALVAYADDAYTVAPLTDDAGNVALFIDALSPDVMPYDGDRPDRGIAEGARLLKRGGFAAGDIVVFGHSGESDARSAAAKARSAGFRVSALGFGHDARSLQDVVAAGGGRYADAGLSDADLRSLGLQSPADDAGTNRDERRKGAALALDDGYWLLFPVMAILLFAFRRGAYVGLLLLVLLPWSPARADDGTWWKRADQVHAERMARGYEAYRRGDYAQAGAAWQGLPGADAAYNRGNALARQKRYDEAIAEYNRALRMAPGMRDAANNRAQVAAERNRADPPPPSQQSPQSRNPQPQNAQPQNAQQQNAQQQNAQRQNAQQQNAQQQNAQQQNAQRQNAQQQNAQQQNAQQRTPVAKAVPAAPTPGDPRRQQAADAAMRAQLQRAQNRGGETGQVARSRAAEATQGRRIADDAWLRRVPDDPGALLRAKFLLEERRRHRDGERR